MKHISSFFGLTAGLLLASGTTVSAQSLVSGFMSGKHHGSVAVSTTAENYKQVYLVPEKVNMVPLYRQIFVTSVNLYASYGLTDKIDAVVSLPYIKSEGRADAQVVQDLGFQNSRQDFQDLTGVLKFKSYSGTVGNYIVDLLGVVAVSTPISNYQSNTGLDYIIAIGNRATKVTTLGVMHVKTASGVFATGQAGYSLRSGLVPNAFLAETKVGFAGTKIYAEALASFQKSDESGTDILQPGFNGNFTATRVDFVRVGVNLFRPLTKGLGASVGVSSYVAGRNVGQSTGISGGLSYNF
ncbi:hypothetical protein [Hymenobacter fodinae]|uniref:Outer membrane beta-barrel porin/alpha-amylase n=1 Tax=Hymenobacter fodinae TaxID=2510796 RepID=A0A4Z0PBP3_9BACT|nr:hypothetical protein [Hymenobacter fodinae]TGE09668.1 hypothetical protein EU556_02195 [Hymenobacter fodinae]